MESFEIPGRHLLARELNAVGGVGVGAAGLRRRAPGAQRGGAALLCVEPRGIGVVGSRFHFATIRRRNASDSAISSMPFMPSSMLIQPE